MVAGDLDEVVNGISEVGELVGITLLLRGQSLALVLVAGVGDLVDEFHPVLRRC
jgi:hypothetical protein